MENLGVGGAGGFGDGGDTVDFGEGGTDGGLTGEGVSKPADESANSDAVGEALP